MQYWWDKADSLIEKTKNQQDIHTVNRDYKALELALERKNKCIDNLIDHINELNNKLNLKPIEKNHTTIDCLESIPVSELG